MIWANAFTSIPQPANNLTFNEMVEILGDIMDVQPQGYGIDKKFSNIYYVPENAHFNLSSSR
jgi:hypothetical protein